MRGAGKCGWALKPVAEASRQAVQKSFGMCLDVFAFVWLSEMCRDTPQGMVYHGTGRLTVGLTCNCVAYNHKGRPPYAHVKWSVEQVERVWRSAEWP